MTFANRMACCCLAALAACAWAGCSQAPPMNMEPPPRAAELDKLSAFVGTWQGDMEMTMGDKTVKGTGTNKIEWDVDKYCLVEHWEGDMGEMGKMTGLGVWAWDSNARKFRIYWFDSHGSVGEGTAWHDDATNTWHFTGETEVGQGGYGEGTMKMPDSNTIEWTHKEWDNAWKWGAPMFDMKGTSRKTS